MKLLPTPNLKKVYKTEWALVTGGSSGIGAALTDLLCKQGLNVAIVALNDDILKKHCESLRAKYPQQQVKAIGVDLTDPETYMNIVKEETKDLDIGMLFNNAGFLRVGVRIFS